MAFKKFRRIHFIINPISGKGKGQIIKKKIEELFSSHEIEIKLTQKKGDAFNFARESVAEKVDLIVSCGGDGTLNEVASALVGQEEIPIAIVPIGSGNGLARHLKIPLNSEKTLQGILFDKFHVEKIDCGKINEHYFFSNAGLGFDAKVIKTYSQQKSRKLWGYVKSVILSYFSFKPFNLKLESKEFNYGGKCMLINFANGNCLGYGFSFSHKSSLKDRLLDVTVIEEVGKWRFTKIISDIFILKSSKSKKRKYFRSSQIDLSVSIDYMQIDGEYHELNTESIKVSVIPQSLSVLANTDKI